MSMNIDKFRRLDMYDHYLPVLSVRISSIFDIVKSVVLHGTIKA